MKAWRSHLLILAIVVGLLLPVSVAEAEFTGLPAGFSDQSVVSGISSPTAIAWLPDGTLLATSRGGQVYRRSGSSLVSILNLGNGVCSGGETGLLGLAVDPQFATGQRYIYLYYTHHKNNASCGDAANRANRVSRFTMGGDRNLSREQVLIDNIAARGGNHNGGDLQFGRDGLLYISVGDSGRDLQTGDGQDSNANARRLDLLNGKILRIAPDGSVPASNPFVGANSTVCGATGQVAAGRSGVTAEKNKKARKRKKQKRRERRRDRNQGQNPPGNGTICGEIFATGLRNPYRIAFDPDDTSGPQRFFINDVGGGAWEEIDDAVAGADYGWNLREGPCKVGSTSNCAPDSRFAAPFYAYPHNLGCRTITGGAFVPNNAGWPQAWRSRYLYADFICDKIFAIDETNPMEPIVLGSGVGATHLAFGPDGALYYTDLGGGAIRRIVYTP